MTRALFYALSAYRARTIGASRVTTARNAALVVVGAQVEAAGTMFTESPRAVFCAVVTEQLVVGALARHAVAAGAAHAGAAGVVRRRAPLGTAALAVRAARAARAHAARLLVIPVADVGESVAEAARADGKRTYAVEAALGRARVQRAQPYAQPARCSSCTQRHVNLPILKRAYAGELR